MFELTPLRCAENGDLTKYPQMKFWVLRSHFELNEWISNSKSLKIMREKFALHRIPFYNDNQGLLRCNSNL